MTATLSKQARPRTGWNWFPWIMMAMIGVTIGANVVLIVFAGQTFPGAVEQNAFDRGNHYNAIMAAAEKQGDLGWHVVIKVEGDRLRVALSDRDGVPLGEVTGTVALHRPVGTETVEKTTLVAEADGVYRTADPVPGRGQWDLDLVVTRGSDQYRISKRVLVP